jgi:glyoxylase-like metal-dependent hydrolase (beta-lactamase superfamily II)
VPSNAAVDKGIRCLDLHFQGRPGVIASYLIEDAGERALIEIGPSSTLDSLLRGLRDSDVDPASISKVLVTHIHLDHAGAAGTFLSRFHGAQLFVHEAGAPHLIDPSKLVASATRIYGELMDSLWGAIDPVPRERMTILTDGDVVTVGKRTFRALYTPGHASHHVAFVDDDRGTIFTGDVAAVRLQGFAYVRPPTPPPDLDLELWDQSLQQLRELSPRILYLTHFGAFRDVDAHLLQARKRLFAWGDIVKHAVELGQQPPEIVDVLRFHGDRELLAETGDANAIERYELATPYGMTVDGYRRYFRNR